MVTESAAISLVGGACSGLVCSVLFQPLDFIKTQLQSNRASSVRGLGSLMWGKAEIYNGLVRRAWWNGLRPSLAKTIPGVACYFATLSQLRKIHGAADIGPVAAIGMGALARAMTVIFVQPLTLIKTRYESGKFGYRTIGGAVGAIIAEEKLTGLYRGLCATIIRDAPFSGLYLAFYTQLKYKAFHGSDSVMSTTVSGLSAGSLAALITHPADVVKTRIQIQHAVQPVRAHHVIASLYSEGGLGAFYLGYLPRFARRTLVSATAWVVYEEIMKRPYLFRRNVPRTYYNQT